LSYPFFKVSVKKTMLASIVTACILCLTLQGVSAGNLLQILWNGYRAPEPALAKMLNGGGIVSMFRAVAIVGLSSSYSGIFAGDGTAGRGEK
jgi:NhaC family Na+:H+ antiporter